MKNLLNYVPVQANDRLRESLFDTFIYLRKGTLFVIILINPVYPNVRCLTNVPGTSRIVIKLFPNAPNRYYSVLEYPKSYCVVENLLTT